MDVKKCLKRRSRKKTRHVTIRVDDEISRWLRRHDFSPTAIFNEAIRELGYRRVR